MAKNKEKWLFNIIAPIYGWFFNHQYKRYDKTFNLMRDYLIGSESAIDIGCGTGALCAVLHDKGLDVTGVDQAKTMLKVANKKVKDRSIKFVERDVFRGLKIKNKTIDIAIASYVAHGIEPSKRKKLYQEMCRIAKKRVIIHDYNQKRHLLTTIIEWLEGGHYFSFIKHPKEQIEAHLKELRTCFDEVSVINVGKRANWYVCTPKSK